MLKHPLIHLIPVLLPQYQHVHVVLYDLARPRDLYGRLELVPRQHKEPDVGLHELRDRDADALLELVLDGRATDVPQLLLQLVKQIEELLFLGRPNLGLKVPIVVLEVKVLAASDVSRGYYEGAEALTRVLVEVLIHD